MQPPSTVAQLTALLLFVLPGVTYQFLRERWRGPVTGEAQLGERILRAITASVALNGLYVVIAGPALARAWAKAERSGASALFAERPRVVALWALLLFLGVPAAVAACVSYRERRHARSTYRPAPTAWDYVFGHRADRGPGFVRARLKDGTWVGGWYGSTSYASGNPHSPDLYLQWSYRMGQDGSFGALVEGSDGIYLRMEDVDILELVQAPPPTGEGTQGDHE
ncbi:DUF6338 family protein [Streptomyces sp. NPDC004838]